MIYSLLSFPSNAHTLSISLYLFVSIYVSPLYVSHAHTLSLSLYLFVSIYISSLRLSLTLLL